MSNFNSDFHNSTVVLKGKHAPKSTTINMDAIQTKTTQTGTNASVLERKIDEGTVTVLPKIDREVSQAIVSARVAKQIGGKTMTQAQLAQSVNGKGIVVADIRDMENGSMTLTTQNKVKINAVKNSLQIKKT